MEPTNMPVKQSYEFKIRILGNEIFAVGIASDSASNKWIGIALVAIFSILTVLGAYGEKIIYLFKLLTA